MKHGITAAHFELLNTWRGTPRQVSDQAQTAASSAVKEAYKATARWAEAVKDQLFPQGFVRKRADAFDQGQTFKPYTWSRIYPRLKAPKGLAFTVGIDAIGEFCVKLDTVNLGGLVRQRYEVLQRYDNHLSPFAAVLPAETGLAMTFEALVEWSVDRISDFDPGYDELALAIGLIPPELKLITDTDLSRAAFARWRSILSAEGREVCAVEGYQVWLSSRGGFGGIEAKLGLDPRGREWGVEINAPASPGDYNSLSAIAADETGGLHLLRQGWLRGRRPAPDIREEEFKAITGLSPEVVSGAGRAALRQWFRVASFDDPPERVRRTTARFVELCWAARTPIGKKDQVVSGNAVSAEADDAVVGGEEHSGDYILPERPAADAKIVRKLHGQVWKSLATILGDSEIGYRKWSRSPGYEIDMEIDAPGLVPLLIEIKTGCSTHDVHTGVGQLMLYRNLFPNLVSHRAVLLIDVDLPSRLREAVAALDIIVHRYRWEGDDGERQVIFAPEFLALCGAAPE
jgi:hypothetical protein